MVRVAGGRVALILLAALGACSGSPSNEYFEAASPRSSGVVDALREDSSLWRGPANALPKGARELPPANFTTDKVMQHIRVNAPQATGLTGKGVIFASVDSGLDFKHEEFRKPDGSTRVKWFIDYGAVVTGKHPELESKFGVGADEAPCKPGKKCLGAIFDESEINGFIANGIPEPHKDPAGHGSHTTGIAVGNNASGIYRGVAPEADIIVARPRAEGDTAGDPTTALVMKGVEFALDRARDLREPVVVNLSLGFLLGAPDRNDLVNRRFSQLGGAPGQAIVVSGGNNGYILDGKTQSIQLVEGVPQRVPIQLGRGVFENSISFIAATGGTNVRMGLDSEEGRWITPIASGTREATLEGTTATITMDPEKIGANRGLLFLRGEFRRDQMAYLRLEGSGFVSLALTANPPLVAQFPYGTRENSITAPGASPDVITVGCTVNRTSYPMMNGGTRHLSGSGKLDEGGGRLAPGILELEDGSICRFSGAGPGPDGDMKPEIVAPGIGVISARDENTTVEFQRSTFLGTSCALYGLDKNCLLATPKYGIASGTSMSTPVVSGIAVLLLQRDPSLSQEAIRRALMAGVHPWRGTHSYRDQSGVGEVDVGLALEAVERMRAPKAVVPDLQKSWAAVSRDFVPADGRPVVVMLELRGKNGELADPADLSDLTAVVDVNGAVDPKPPIVERLAAGLFQFRYTATRGAGPGVVSFGARYKGSPVVAPQTVPIATDWWSARYPATAASACATGAPRGTWSFPIACVLALLFLARKRRECAS